MDHYLTSIFQYNRNAIKKEILTVLLILISVK